jgi:DTW domain-containing protein YfiP
MMPNQRPVCSRCLRPQRTCICHWITPVDAVTEVLFLQHPLEVGQAKGSAFLLHASLANSRLVIGETFTEEELRALLYAPFADDDAQAEIHPLLLYPDDQKRTVEAAQSHSIQQAVRHRLIVLDATWRKSRKMMHVNPLLQQLPRLALRNPPTSRYAIRKAHRADQLSTFEATCYALMQLEQNDSKYRPLLTAFDGFVTQQQSYVPAADGSNSP